ncbi:MAG: DUF4038 domain-containing protein [Bacteroidales bacterium]|nr:DUF4038 domain-containing protein [Bacteroidales bacterium]
MKRILMAILTFSMVCAATATERVSIWNRFEIRLESEQDYTNPLYAVRSFYAVFTAPSGRAQKINGFWDGEKVWKIRFMPDETGEWSYFTHCSDTTNGGLHSRSGSFECTLNSSQHRIYAKGRITRESGNYHLNYEDGTPFFWVGCTAWNGGLKSTPEEWNHYLEQRSENGYNVIQLVATQWRGCDQNSQGDVAFTGSGRISINPRFFQHFDDKMDRVNEYGHVAGLVLLWALPFGRGRDLSPGYYLPDQEAILLARYMVARYGGHHVVWILGGDGKFFGELEDRWKFIGRQVFRDDPPGLATLHPHGISWLGEIYGDEEWFDIDGYQSSHGTGKRHVNFINQTIAEGWKKNSPKPVINLEPCYEQIRNAIFEDDVRNACYWSVFAAPPSGITYGADGIWPWIRNGEKPLNHSYTTGVSTWDKSIELPGSKQIGYLGSFMNKFAWWNLLPAQGLLLEQPGEEDFRRHLSVLKSIDQQQILVYFPQKQDVRLFLPSGSNYQGAWFNPVNNEYNKISLEIEGRVLKIVSPYEKDAVLVLTGE